eukprot:scaffold81177_cov33-Phaeocystis_antarctica.AAC.1
MCSAKRGEAAEPPAQSPLSELPRATAGQASCARLLVVLVHVLGGFAAGDLVCISGEYRCLCISGEFRLSSEGFSEAGDRSAMAHDCARSCSGRT